MSFTYKYAHPAVTADTVLFGFDAEGAKLLLVQRERDPYAGKWALPGGFVEPDEDLLAGAVRELQEETGLSGIRIEQLHAFGEPRRDPRERVISVAYYGCVRLTDHPPRADSDALAVTWFPVTALPELAFDHAGMVEIALRKLRSKIRIEPFGAGLLPGKFTLADMHRLYTSALGRPIDKRRFCKKILGAGLVRPFNKDIRPDDVKGAQYYRFNPPRYDELVGSGFNFDL